MMSLGPVKIEGFLKIYDPNTQEVLVDKQNAIHYENMSIALALSLADAFDPDTSRNLGFIEQMSFGNGGSSVDPTGVITYLPPNVTGKNADLYNNTFFKIVNQRNPANNDATRNLVRTLHTPGTVFSDVLVSCLLDFGEPAGQQAFDNSTDFNGDFVFDELGLKARGESDNELMLITHVIFHPVQKSLNRQIQIDYTVRIQTLTNLSAA
jgi:hypothetical protein